MRKLLSFLFLCTAINAHGQADSLRYLLKTVSFFRLENYLAANQSRIGNSERLYYQAYLDNAFNRIMLSTSRADSFLHLPVAARNDSETANMLMLQIDNYGKAGRYRDAAETGRQVLSRFVNAISNENRKDVTNTTNLWAALADEQAQTISQHADVLVPVHRDKVGLWNIKVSAGGESDDFILDTGANISTISESQAEKMKIRRKHVAISVAASQGKTVTADVGVADSLAIGDIVLRNVVFLVMPDKVLYLKRIRYRINGIVGFPVINAMKEIRIAKTGMMKVPATASHSLWHNLALDGYEPIINVVVEHKDTLEFNFDSGAGATDLFSAYFDQYRDHIKDAGDKLTVLRGGAGGARRTKTYELPGVWMHVGSKDCTLHNVSVLTKPVDSSHELIYGNMGQDVINQFGEVVINLEDMFIDFN